MSQKNYKSSLFMERNMCLKPNIHCVQQAILPLTCSVHALEQALVHTFMHDSQRVSSFLYTLAHNSSDEHI